MDVPKDARTGRYEVDVDHERSATSFAVHRKVVQVARIEMERTFYTTEKGIIAATGFPWHLTFGGEGGI